MAVQSFKSKALRRFWEQNDSSGLPQSRVEKISRMLDLLDAAENLIDLHPFYRFHEYRGSGQGVYSFDVGGNDRLLFRFRERDAFDLW